MAICSRQNVCPLFTVPSMAPARALRRAIYCDADPARCERLRCTERGETPPTNMLPNGKLLMLSDPRD